MHRFGLYGNEDSTGKDGQKMAPAIPLGWPIACGVNSQGRVYINDVLNHRIARADLLYETEMEVEIK